jgi:hypothetical protein
MNLEKGIAYIAPLIDWAQSHATLLAWLIALSVLAAIAVMLALPLIVIAIPEDYFLQSRDGRFGFTRQHPILRILLLILKNGVGILLLIVGMLLLFTPGQGLLTIFIGLMLMNFPGKRKLEQRLIQVGGIRRGANWIRRKAGKGELLVPGKDRGSD